MAAVGERENEIKLAVASAEEGRRRLECAGFRLHKGRVFESNTLFDTPDGRLRQARRLLRIREVNGASLLTYKGAPEPGRHKSREELELRFEPAGVLARIFERLGYVVSFRYEKYRSEYVQPGEPGVATLDETPIGVFFELEGDGAWIDAAAVRLGFGQREYILASYASLYLDYCRASGAAPGEGMLFPGSSATTPA